MQISNKFKAIAKAFVAVLAISVVLTACSKNNDPGEPLQLAGMSIINASPSLDELDFYVGNTRANQQVLKYNTQIDYLGLYPGLANLTLTKRNESTSLVTKQEGFVSGKFYTVFVIDIPSKRALLKVEDNLSAPVADKAKVRFINLSPDAAALSLSVVGKDAELVTNKAFKEFSDFVAVDPGDNLTFNIKDNTTKEILTSLSNVKIEKNKIYTIYAKGLKTSTDDFRFSATVYSHKLN